MSDRWVNVYDDTERAAAYARLEFPGTYHLAFRDLPAILGRHVRGTRAIDFGCGAGRSTRFLRQLGFDVVGLDVSEPMLAQARARDPEGDYRLTGEDDLGAIAAGACDLALAAFTFDNVPTMERKHALLRSLERALSAGGRIVNLVSSPEIYLHEWVSFSTRDFPENRDAQNGDRVRIVMLDGGDRRPVEDVLWTDEAWGEVYRRAGLRAIETHRPLGKAGEPCDWVSETTIAPWVIYVLEAIEEPAPRA
ncbi:MAG TPA: class I SAM-dependent methyltransferase [Candidatus Eisenbacteria bacterium]|jgi:SAM-dependent methyltransferase